MLANGFCLIYVLFDQISRDKCHLFVMTLSGRFSPDMLSLKPPSENVKLNGIGHISLGAMSKPHGTCAHFYP